MAYELKTVAEYDYIDFTYNMDDLLENMKMNSQIVAAGLVAEGKIKNPESVELTDDEPRFFNKTCKAAVEMAFAIMAQLSRELKLIIPTTEFDIANRTVAITSWDIAIEDYIVKYVLKDWYSLKNMASDAGFPVAKKTLFDIAWSRSISDLKWLAVGTVEEARLSLEEGFKEYEDEFLVTK